MNEQSFMTFFIQLTHPVIISPVFSIFLQAFPEKSVIKRSNDLDNLIFVCGVQEI